MRTRGTRKVHLHGAKSRFAVSYSVLSRHLQGFTGNVEATILACHRIRWKWGLTWLQRAMFIQFFSTTPPISDSTSKRDKATSFSGYVCRIYRIESRHKQLALLNQTHEDQYNQRACFDLIKFINTKMIYGCVHPGRETKTKRCKLHQYVLSTTIQT